MKGIAIESEYPSDHFTEKSFIQINQASNVSIRVEGIIDGDGDATVFQKGNDGKDRPYLVHVRRSKNVVIKDIHLRNSALSTLCPFENEGVRMMVAAYTAITTGATMESTSTSRM